jgi:hypothetical protein
MEHNLSSAEDMRVARPYGHPAQDYHGSIHDHIAAERERHTPQMDYARDMHHMGEDKHYSK